MPAVSVVWLRRPAGFRMTLMTGWVYFWNAARSLTVNQAISFYLKPRPLTKFEEKKRKVGKRVVDSRWGHFLSPEN